MKRGNCKEARAPRALWALPLGRDLRPAGKSSPTRCSGQGQEDGSVFIMHDEDKAGLGTVGGSQEDGSHCCHLGGPGEDDRGLATIIISAAKAESVGEKPKKSDEVTESSRNLSQNPME
jgi:hypothetical protein